MAKNYKEPPPGAKEPNAAQIMELLKTVAMLRHFQQLYLRTRSKIILTNCIELEHKVDKLLAKHNLTYAPKEQPIQNSFEF